MSYKTFHINIKALERLSQAIHYKLTLALYWPFFQQIKFCVFLQRILRRSRLNFPVRNPQLTFHNCKKLSVQMSLTESRPGFWIVQLFAGPSLFVTVCERFVYLPLLAPIHPDHAVRTGTWPLLTFGAKKFIRYIVNLINMHSLCITFMSGD